MVSSLLTGQHKDIFVTFTGHARGFKIELDLGFRVIFSNHNKSDYFGCILEKHFVKYFRMGDSEK